MFNSLISTYELAQQVDNPTWLVVDCRFALTAKEQGQQNYLAAHIKGALYAHLERDLSNTIIPGVTGRHPWPDVDQAARFFASIGVDETIQVVAYDDLGGSLAAVRLWWMLRWLGHEAVAVLDGGWQKWVKEELPVQTEIKKAVARTFVPKPRPQLIANMEEVNHMRLDPTYRVFDARTAERYRGENEFIDPIAGHIPGAISAPYIHNLAADNTFRPVKELHKIYQEYLGDIPAERAVFYCGSGVTSIHNALAMLHAGLGEARIYAGSWSEWITDPRNPIATV